MSSDVDMVSRSEETHLKSATASESDRYYLRGPVHGQDLDPEVPQ
jgi:hypothetical protein